METEARGQQGWGQMLGWGGTRLALGQLLAVGTAPQRPPAYSRFVRQIKSFLISGVSPHRITGFPHIGKERKPRRLGYGKRQGWGLQGPPSGGWGFTEKKTPESTATLALPEPHCRPWGALVPTLLGAPGRFAHVSDAALGEGFQRARQPGGTLSSHCPSPRDDDTAFTPKGPRGLAPLPLVPAPASRVGAGRPQAHPD